jgi:release factor glutamine methyltransferase
MSASITVLLSQKEIDKREAQMLLAHVLGISRAFVIAHAERTLDAAQEQRVRSLFSRRAAGEPIAYLLGTREFYGRDFVVSPATLIPRPETELIVEQALARLSEHKWPGRRASAGVSREESARDLTSPSSQRRLGPSPVVQSDSTDGLGPSLRWDDEVNANFLPDSAPHILDLGTGSGAIAVTLALERPDAIVVAADISPDALDVANQNAHRLNAEVEFIQSNWYANLTDRKFDLIVSNPPYVAGRDKHLSEGDLRFEPQIALTDESSDGLQSIRSIVEGAPAHLHPGGWLLFEHGYDQVDACRALLLKAGFENLISIDDLAGIPRVAGGQIR